MYNKHRTVQASRDQLEEVTLKHAYSLNQFRIRLTLKHDKKSC